jgi:hypothetical protein
VRMISSLTGRNKSRWDPRRLVGTGVNVPRQAGPSRCDGRASVRAHPPGPGSSRMDSPRLWNLEFRLRSSIGTRWDAGWTWPGSGHTPVSCAQSVGSLPYIPRVARD